MRLAEGLFFNDTATTEIYTLSLHDALPISGRLGRRRRPGRSLRVRPGRAVQRPLPQPGPWHADRDERRRVARDRKSTRLNSSHANISYAVFCLKKKIAACRHVRPVPALVGP